MNRSIPSLLTTRCSLSSPQPIGRSMIRWSSSSSATPSLIESLKSVMRSSAQPVSLITCLLPPLSSSSTTSQSIHATTISSFSSISLSPPLICFSIKTPSRLIDSLQHHGCFVLNLLSDQQSDLASHYSNPGTSVYSLPSSPTPTPTTPTTTTTTKSSNEHPLHYHSIRLIDSKFPILTQALGCFTCSVIQSIPLSKNENNSSILFLAKVENVFSSPPPPSSSPSSSSTKKLPLVYWNQSFVTVDTLTVLQSKKSRSR